jgi:hypothetical protein
MDKSSMDKDELFKFVLAHQAEWGNAYREQERKRKLAKNREEKKRYKEKLKEEQKR